ncbi:MAG: folate family ECF transporter S component [Tissierellia bacterium]|nr:folate family ECF transporter S component [Tissierellia bacterium]
MNKYKNNRTKTLVLAAILISLQVVLTRIIAIEFTQYFRLGGAFFALSLNGALLGPVTAGLSSMVADIIGYLLKPTGPYFPGFTITAGISGLLYGIFLYKKELTWKNIAKATGAVTLNNYFINSIWLTILFGIPYFTQLKVRLLGEIAVFIVKTIILTIVLPKIMEALKKM